MSLICRFKMCAIRALLFVSLGAIAGFGCGAVAAPTQHGSTHGAYTLAGRVVHVADGDTFTLLVEGHQERIRLASIDAPETTHGRERPGQPFGQVSKDALAKLVAGKTLDLICFERDRYERNVCDVPLADGSTANRKQVADGVAWANMEGHGKYMRDPKIPELEAQARRSRLGLWQSPDPVRPWVWRYQCWKQGQC
ncbi:MAG: thermonuclease family protein [Burkholderiaceae bacterium]